MVKYFMHTIIDACVCTHKETQKPKPEGHTYDNVHKFTIFLYTSSTGKQEITLPPGFVSSNNSHSVLHIHSLKQSQSMYW